MNRRALLAIFVSTLLIITYELFFMPKPPPPEMVEGDDVGRGAAPQGMVGGDLSAPADRAVESGGMSETVEEETLLAAPVSDVVSEIIEVSTPLFSMELDTRGGVIRSTRLLTYDATTGGPVVLHDEGSPGGLGLLVNTSDGEIDLRRVVFAADRSSIRVVDEGASETINLEQSLDNGISIRRSFTFHCDSYRIDVVQQILKQSSSPEIFSYRMLWEPGVAFTEGDPVYEKDQTGAVTAVGTEVVRDRTRKVKEEGIQRTGNVRWTAVQGKYFAIALIPVNEPSADVWIRRIGEENRVWFDAKFPVRSAVGTQQEFGLYVGPVDMEALVREGVGLEGMIDLGWSLIQPISRLMLVTITWMHKFIPNYGWVIVLISILTKLLFYRLTHKSFQSMKDMQKIQGQVNELKEKHKSDSQKMNKEMWALYKREGVNPMGGCLPMLLQMPVFIALYSVLRATIQLRQAHFLFWITDLSRPDVLFHMPFPLPFLGSDFCLLPILMGISMFLQQKMTTVDPRQKMMIYMMPILFTVMFYRLPSGLVLYWFVNNVLSIAQQWMIHRGGDKKGPGNDKTFNTTNKNGREDQSGNRSNRGGGRKRLPPAKETT